MTQQNTSRFGTAFTESIEAREGVTTGISAYDRAHTIRTAIEPRSTAADLARPGHIFPLRARKGGVLVRAGQTEASVDLARLAGLNPSGVLCEIMKDDGDDGAHSGSDSVLQGARAADSYRGGADPLPAAHERYIVRAGESRIQTRYGEFRMIAYESQVNGGESHIALVRGELCPIARPSIAARLSAPGGAGLPVPSLAPLS
jgi:3,4-dihydroxy 2-butanone 4-phosphate synthase/GTP cyclohydrolase II